MVSVLMSVHDEDETVLRAAISSILHNTYKDYEFLIVLDGCSHQTREAIRSFKDDRIRIIENNVNIGLTKSLNKAMESAVGRYFVRMDADDISHGDRIRIQVRFMEHHPHVIACGTRAIESADMNVIGQTAHGKKRLKIQLLFAQFGLIHPSVILDAKRMRDAGITYDERIKKSQDYDLWTRLIDHGNLAVIKKPLLLYRVSDSQISTKFGDEQRRFEGEIQLDFLKRNGIELSDREGEIFLSLSRVSTSSDPGERLSVIHSIQRQNRKSGTLSFFLLERELLYLWIRAGWKKDIWKYAYTYRLLFPWNLLYLAYKLISIRTMAIRQGIAKRRYLSYIKTYFEIQNEQTAKGVIT